MTDAPQETATAEQDLPVEKLPARYAAFVAEYLIDLRPGPAYTRAGFRASSADNASSLGSRLLKKPEVAAAVERGRALRLSRVGMTQDTVLNEMSILALSRVEHYVIDDFGNVQLAEGAPDGAMGAIQSIKKRIHHHYNGDELTGTTYEVELKLWDKPTPLKLMGKHVGIFPDRMEHTGKNGGPIETATLTTEELVARHRALTEVTEK